VDAAVAQRAANRLQRRSADKRDFVANDFSLLFVDKKVVGMHFLESAFDLHNTGAKFDEHMSEYSKTHEKEKKKISVGFDQSVSRQNSFCFFSFLFVLCLLLLNVQ